MPPASRGCALPQKARYGAEANADDPADELSCPFMWTQDVVRPCTCPGVHTLQSTHCQRYERNCSLRNPRRSLRIDPQPCRGYVLRKRRISNSVGSDGLRVGRTGFKVFGETQKSVRDSRIVIGVKDEDEVRSLSAELHPSVLPEPKRPSSIRRQRVGYPIDPINQAPP
jgi:hypothetical protein